jgi:hypothetical protein
MRHDPLLWPRVGAFSVEASPLTLAYAYAQSSSARTASRARHLLTEEPVPRALIDGRENRVADVAGGPGTSGHRFAKLHGEEDEAGRDGLGSIRTCGSAAASFFGQRLQLVVVSRQRNRSGPEVPTAKSQSRQKKQK